MGGGTCWDLRTQRRQRKQPLTGEDQKLMKSLFLQDLEPRCSLRYTSAYYYVRYVYFYNYVTYVPIFQALAQKSFL